MSQVPLRPSCCSLRGAPGILRGLRPRAHNTDRTGRDGTGHPPRPKRTATSGRGRGFVAHQEPALDSGVAPCRAAHTLARLDSAPSALSPCSENFASRCLVAWESRSPIVRERLSSGSANRKLREGQSGAGRGGAGRTAAALHSGGGQGRYGGIAASFGAGSELGARGRAGRYRVAAQRGGAGVLAACFAPLPQQDLVMQRDSGQKALKRSKRL